MDENETTAVRIIEDMYINLFSVPHHSNRLTLLPTFWVFKNVSESQHLFMRITIVEV